MTLLDLPDELLSEIVSFLRSVDLSSLMLVSSRLRLLSVLPFLHATGFPNEDLQNGKLSTTTLGFSHLAIAIGVGLAPLRGLSLEQGSPPGYSHRDGRKLIRLLGSFEKSVIQLDEIILPPTMQMFASTREIATFIVTAIPHSALDIVVFVMNGRLKISSRRLQPTEYIPLLAQPRMMGISLLDLPVVFLIAVVPVVAVASVVYNAGTFLLARHRAMHHIPWCDESRITHDLGKSPHRTMRYRDPLHEGGKDFGMRVQKLRGGELTLVTLGNREKTTLELIPHPELTGARYSAILDALELREYLYVLRITARCGIALGSILGVVIRHPNVTVLELGEDALDGVTSEGSTRVCRKRMKRIQAPKHHAESLKLVFPRVSVWDLAQ